ncbi:tRNA 2-selenouridine(34) synthase MnmH [Paracoccaceae bacterium GXU_MW_L88]
MPVLDTANYDAVIDVRSPAEFTEDHIPGAINLPVLSNDERAEIGTLYTQISRFEARRRGAALVSANIARHLDGPLAYKPAKFRPLVYCWRGGMRSNSFAHVLRQVGWPAEVVEGGYRTYRRAVAARLYDEALPFQPVLIDGNTGTAKTEILKSYGGLKLDLEGLANHRGSVFGAQGAQPSQKMFESRLADAMEGLTGPVLVEAESNKIGELLIPPSLWKAMQTAPRIMIDAPLDARADFLMRAYGDISEDRAALVEILRRLKPLQGKDQVAAWEEMVAAGEIKPLARDLLERHYDPAYRRSRGEPVVAETVRMVNLNPSEVARAASEIAEIIADL